MDRPVRERAVIALKRGVLTFDEVVKLAGVARSTVFRWCRDEGIDWRSVRMNRAVEEWRRTYKPRGRKPSKAKLRQMADEAKVAWDLSHEA